MPAFGLALAASAVRVASLNLCTDEYLLMLGHPEEIASVSYLSALREESVLWRQAARHPRNDGSLESVLRFRPSVVLTMGGGGRDTQNLARRLGVTLLDLPYPRTIGDVQRQAIEVAKVLGDPGRARTIQLRLVDLARSKPARAEDAAFLSRGGHSLPPQSLGAQWLRLAGYAQRPLPQSRLSLEMLATTPPKWLIRSNYRSTQLDSGQAWLRHPILARKSARTIETDGRPWTCGGLPMINEVLRLRGQRR